MTPKTKKSTAELAERAFFEYLVLYYTSNRSKIRKTYTTLSKKFLDFNDPTNSSAFLRAPQFQALEMYVFLKEYCNNRFLQDIFNEWKNKTGPFEGRGEYKENVAGQTGFFETEDTKVIEKAFQTVSQDQIYPNYIFALTMGVGKTILMATSIFYEFLLANKYPNDKRFCHNALVFAPDRTVLESLREIQTFDKSLVVPPEYVNWLETHLQFHHLDQSGIPLSLIDRSNFNIIISNTQKIILKRLTRATNATENLFAAESQYYQPGFVDEEFQDLFDISPGDEGSLKTNQRFEKLTRLQQLGIYVDEAHHIFGNKLESDLQDSSKTTSLRNTINILARELENAGTHVVACYNYTGTPYAKNKLLPQVVYSYGLREAIDNQYLKKVIINGYSNTKSYEFIKAAITEFWETYGDNRYEDMLPKIAIFATTIDELQHELKPALEKVLHNLDVPTHKILVNVGDPKLTSNDEIREFNNLDSPSSEKQFILLVGKGKEGWNCRSLFAVALHRRPKSKIFVLQATMRCLRELTDVQQTAKVYLSDENVDILDNELQNNFRMDISILTTSGSNKKQVEVKVVQPPKKIKIKRIQRLHQLLEKSPGPGIDFDLKNVDTSKYDIVGTVHDIRNVERLAWKAEKIEDLKESRDFSLYTLAAEISRYLNKSPLTIETLLTESKDGIKTILNRVNTYNELLYDVLIPKLFHELYEIKEFDHHEEHEVTLANPPKDGKAYYEFMVDPNLLADMNNPNYEPYKSKSFHLDKYCFDSSSELKYFWHLLKSNLIDEVYFTGMLTHGQSEFRIYYIDPESNTLRSYYPDFIIQKSDGTYEIIEVKADYMVDDAIIQAKKEFASQIAVASGMTYEMIPSSKVDRTMPLSENSPTIFKQE